MSAAWPDNLPAPTADSVSVAQADLRQALTMDSGAVRRIRRGNGALYRIRAKLLLTDTQLDAFRHFYRFELRDGAWWFTAAWLDGLGLTGYAARFVEPPAFTRRSALLTEAELRLEVIDAAQALDAGDWPISNVVTPTGIPTDHLAVWIKPDAFPWPAGHGFPVGSYLPSHHDPNVQAKIYRGGYNASCTVGSWQGFVSLSLNPDGLYDYMAGHYPGCIWLLVPLAQIFDASMAVVYGSDRSDIGLLMGRAPDIRYAPDSVGWGNRTDSDYYSAEYGRVRISVGDGYSGNSPVAAPPSPYLRVAVFNTPFRHGSCEAWWNGQPQVTNFPARYKVFGRAAGGSLLPGHLVVGANYAGGAIHHMHILELVIWCKRLSLAEITAVNNYFIDKYQVPL